MKLPVRKGERNMKLGEKVIGTKRTGSALSKGTLQAGRSFLAGNIPCQILPAELRPSSGKASQVWAPFKDGCDRKIGYCQTISVEMPEKATLLILDYTKVGDYSKAYRILTPGNYDPEGVRSLCQRKMAEQELDYESFDPKANQWIG